MIASDESHPFIVASGRGIKRSMTQIFDVVVVGSGPSSFAALTALLDIGYRKSICVVTGETTARQQIQHPKIISTDFENKSPPAFADVSQDNILFSSNVVGGLSNYWGRQLVRYEPHEQWGSTGARSFNEYSAICEKIESIIGVAGGTILLQRKLQGVASHLRHLA